jgi:glucosamine-6-phosphate deaminase
MRIVLTQEPEEAAELVSSEILRQLAEKPNLVLGLATGSTPIGIYHKLAEAYERRDADFSAVHTFNLDEYLDLPAGHERGYRRFMDDNLFKRINVPRQNINFPPSEGDQLERRCEEFEERIRAVGGIDIQILGIGSNGHIGFNEPTSSLRSRTRVKTLTQKTLTDNSRFYAEGEHQPELAVTMGIGTILDARKIVLQAFGDKKAEAIRATVEGPISSTCPGSALQQHPATILYLDPESAALLHNREYYAHAQRQQRRLRQEGRL